MVVFLKWVVRGIVNYEIEIMMVPVMSYPRLTSSSDVFFFTQVTSVATIYREFRNRLTEGH